MKKLLDGIAEFQRTIRPSYREKFAKLALGQSPDCLFFACSDSRVVPNLFASTEPGDLFVVRNVGNLVPPCGPVGISTTDRSEGAAVEFALQVLGVRDIVVCGHSDCGAMRGLLSGATPEQAPNLREWLEVAQSSLQRLNSNPIDTTLPLHNQLSQVNVLQQVANLRTYPDVAERLAAGKLRIHAWWFDLARAEVLSFFEDRGRFEPLVGSTDTTAQT
jgi:carbonic anhydrase